MQSKTEFLILIFSLITLFLIFSILQHLAGLLRNSISIDISFEPKFLLNVHVSAPYVTVILTNDGFLSISKTFHSGYMTCLLQVLYLLFLNLLCKHTFLVFIKPRP
jgi:hypothetical protein